MEQNLVAKQGQEECLYCHGNGNTERAGSCPVCGDITFPKTYATNPGPVPPRKIDARLKVLYEPVVSGV